MSAREVIRVLEKACAECRRRKAKACEQIMAPLPISRLKKSLRAFTRTVVDFVGPFITVQGRGKRRAKRYLCLFTCLATRAIHLEIAFGLGTDSFLNSFYRMVSPRGLPKEVYSDNGTNFKGAVNELKLLVSQIDEDKITESAANKGVKWHFKPPLAVHFSGVHEAMIKSAKPAISAILGNADINDEELMTAIIGAEGLINSRSLTYQSANPVDDVTENSAPESVLTLRTWVLQESEFQTVATETVHLLTGQSSNQAAQPFYRNNNQRAFFVKTAEEDGRVKSIECQLCKEPHRIWNCQHFADKAVTE